MGVCFRVSMCIWFRSFHTTSNIAEELFNILPWVLFLQNNHEMRHSVVLQSPHNINKFLPPDASKNLPYNCWNRTCSSKNSRTVQFQLLLFVNITFSTLMTPNARIVSPISFVPYSVHYSFKGSATFDCRSYIRSPKYFQLRRGVMTYFSLSRICGAE